MRINQIAALVMGDFNKLCDEIKTLREPVELLHVDVLDVGRRIFRIYMYVCLHV